MKTYLHAFAMCQSMFCAIPCPWNIWDEKAKDKMLLFLPVVGLEIGVLWAALARLTQLLSFPALVRGILLCAYPFLVTGCIHLDGFMDVTDAVKSWRDLDRRREILKDSHVGSFAVIHCILLMLAQFAFFASGTDNHFILLFVPALSRCCSALAVTGLKPMSTSQYAATAKNKKHLVILVIMLCIIVAAGFLCCGIKAFALVALLAGYGLALRRGYRSLEGMNGDISGYALTIGELCAIAVCAIV
ncbi:MAG: adenosylcobinamide-GDP ribazoletransferase [Firmicutes bacterium]|nr:adenosylcobinamide-GDP ribazoletransferase [Bacillota bacterium]